MAGAIRGSVNKIGDHVKVVVRCRPMNTKEHLAGYSSVVRVSTSQKLIQISEPEKMNGNKKLFTFDAVYDSMSTQQQVYEESVKPIVDSVLNGFNATIFAYGQTGTGKTHTMEGKQFHQINKGIIPRSFTHIFDHITSSNSKYAVSCSYIELYQEEIRDLLDTRGNKKYELKGGQNNVYIDNLNSYACKSAEEMDRAMKFGNQNRKTAATDMNERSSRSHAIFTITIEMMKSYGGIKQVKFGKLNLVDLAGSERIAKSKSTGLRFTEATKINLSLTALSKVISALSSKRCTHIPYRDSKLTRILQDSLEGNAKTLMIANIGPASYNYIESMNTLMYANRAKNIKNTATMNVDLTEGELIENCQAVIERLKAQVLAKYPNIDMNKLLCTKQSKKNKIRELEYLIQNEEARTYRTCEVIEQLHLYRELEKQVFGTDTQTLVTKQQHKLKVVQKKLQIIEESNKKLKIKLEAETNKVLHCQTLCKKLIEKIDYDTEYCDDICDELVRIKQENPKIKAYFDNERKDLKRDLHTLRTLYEREKRISAEMFPHSPTRNYLLQEIKAEDPERWKVSSKFHYILPDSQLKGNATNHSKATESTDKKRTEPHRETSRIPKRVSKFKNNIIVKMNRCGIKQYIELDQELPDSEATTSHILADAEDDSEIVIPTRERKIRLRKLLEKY